MSKLVMVCVRDGNDVRPKLDAFLESLCPDNLRPEHVVTADGRGLYLGVFRPHGPVTDQTAYVGWFREESNGSYAVFKGGETIELHADAAASRTIWIAHTPELFVASTSLRAIPYFLGSFELNRNAVAWMLSSGCIGPGLSWDVRARPLGPYGRASFDRARWQLTIDEPDTDLRPLSATAMEHRARIESVVSHSCSGRFDDFAICMSGGRDSRNIAQRMNRDGIKAITWGDSASLDNPESDAAIAQQVARHYGFEHQFFPIDTERESVETVLRRFVHCSEGRIDNVGGYMDGFALWKHLTESGVRGIIRGDNLFGCQAAHTEHEAAAKSGLLTLDSMRNTLPLRELGIEHLETSIPSHLAKRAGERPQDWYHRLMHGFRQPAMIAALNEIKSAYVEIANPLNVHTCVEVARSLPSALRDNKSLFDSLAEDGIPFARDRAIRDVDETIHDFGELIADELHSQRTAENFSPQFGAYVANGMTAPNGTPRKRARKLRKIIGRMLPTSVRRKLSSVDKRRVSAHRLALRVYLANATIDLLQTDARGARSLDQASRGASERSTARMNPR